MEDVYSFKDILIAFRTEYLNIKNELSIIKEDIKIIDSSLQKTLVLLEPETSSIVFYFLEKEKMILEKLFSIENKLGIPIYNLENINYDSSVKEIFHLKNDINHYHLVIENILDFNKKIINILESDFVKYMKQNQIINIFNNSIINYDYNHLTEESLKNESIIRDFNYYPNKDFVKINYSKKINQDILYNSILNTTYSQNLFNDYQRNVIETIKPFDKKIELLDEYSFGLDFSIIEEDKKLILKRQ